MLQRTVLMCLLHSAMQPCGEASYTYETSPTVHVCLHRLELTWSRSSQASFCDSLH